MVWAITAFPFRDSLVELLHHLCVPRGLVACYKAETTVISRPLHAFIMLLSLCVRFDFCWTQFTYPSVSLMASSLNIFPTVIWSPDRYSPKPLDIFLVWWTRRVCCTASVTIITTRREFSLNGRWTFLLSGEWLIYLPPAEASRYFHSNFSPLIIISYRYFFELNGK